MKINKDIFISATAEAMSKESAKKLFKSEPSAFDMFSTFALAVFIRLDGKDITEDDFSDTVASVIVDTIPDKVTDGTMIKDLALLIFSLQIWDELVKLDKPESRDTESGDFKSVLKSFLSK